MHYSPSAGSGVPPGHERSCTNRQNQRRCVRAASVRPNNSSRLSIGKQTRTSDSSLKSTLIAILEAPFVEPAPTPEPGTRCRSNRLRRRLNLNRMVWIQLCSRGTKAQSPRPRRLLPSPPPPRRQPTTRPRRGPRRRTASAARYGAVRPAPLRRRLLDCPSSGRQTGPGARRQRPQVAAARASRSAAPAPSAHGARKQGAAQAARPKRPTG